MSRLIDLTGKRYGRLTVIKRYGSTPSKMATWLCKCDCGNEKIVQTCHLNSGATTSCGCYQKEIACKANSTHKSSKDRLYYIWQHMKSRCYNPNYYYYHKYGGRGISVCDDWKNSFENFQKWAYETGYNETLTIDRINNDKGYEPSNCRWATKKQQSTNRSITRFVNYHGDEDSLVNMCRKLNVNSGTIRSRMKKGISFEQAVDNFKKTAPFVDYTLVSKQLKDKDKLSRFNPSPEMALIITL